MLIRKYYFYYQLMVLVDVSEQVLVDVTESFFSFKSNILTVYSTHH